MLTIGNNELGAPMKKGDLITCPQCGAQHEVLLCKNKETKEESNTLMVYKCPETGHSYLCGINGKSIMHKFY